jgi:hypothetical protein
MRSLLAAALLASALTGCSGYRWVHYGGALGDVRRVAILPLGNKSYEPGADALASDALLREFQRRGSVVVVSDPKDADLVLSGSVLPFGTHTRSFSSVAFALEYEVSMGLELSVRRRDGTSIRFGPGVLRESELYLASSDVEVQRKNREEAIRRLSTVLASRVHDALAEKLSAPAEPARPAASPAAEPGGPPAARPAEPPASPSIEP